MSPRFATASVVEADDAARVLSLDLSAAAVSSYPAAAASSSSWLTRGDGHL